MSNSPNRRPGQSTRTPVESLERRVLLAAGDLDPTFGRGGKVTTDVLDVVASQFADTQRILALSDGRLLVAVAGIDGFELARYDADGSLDTTFGGGDGLAPVIRPERAEGHRAASLAPSPDGKFVVAGISGISPGFGVGVSRFNPDGGIDTTFGGGDGAAIARESGGAFPAFDDTAQAVVVLPDGKVLTAGVRSAPNLFADGATREVLLVRFNPDGSLDTTFGGDGRVTRDLGGDESVLDLALVPGAGGDFVIGGSVNGQMMVARFHPDGSLDGGFGGGDGVATAPAGVRGTATAVAVADDGTVTAGGYGLEEIPPDVGAGLREVAAVARFGPDGGPDAAFGAEGVALTRFAAGEFFSAVNAVGLLPGGEVLVVGYSTPRTFEPTRLAVARLSNAGAVADVTTAVAGSGYDLALLPGGKLAVAGAGSDYTQKKATAAFGVARFDALLDPDPTFSPGGADGDGVVTTVVGSHALAAHGVALAPDGKIVVANQYAHFQTNAALARYNPDGSLDRTFGGRGDGLTGGTPLVFLSGNGLAVLPTGHVLVAGQSTGGSSNEVMGLARYRPDGTLDTSFGGGDGVATARVLGNGDDARALAVQPDGKLLVAGRGAFDNFILARFNPDGSLDPTFGPGDFEGDGKVSTNFGGADSAEAIALLPDGRFVVAGTVDDRLALARYNADGTLDVTFGGDGKLVTGLPAEAVAALVLTVGGKLLTAALTGFGFEHARAVGDEITVARFNPDGSPDLSFGGGDGRARAGFGAITGARAMDVTSDGRIVVTGESADGDFAVARFLADGAPDTGFGAGGRVVTDFFGGYLDSAHAVVVDADDRIVAVGESAGDYALARYLGGGGDGQQPPPAGAAAYEAERAGLSGAVTSNAFPGYTGDGFVDFINPTSDHVEFTVDAPSAGAYALEFRYANGSGAARAMGLSANGSDVAGGVSFGPTGSWEAWQVAAARVQLNTGANRIRLAATGQSGPNLDRLVVSPATQPPPPDARTFEAERATLSGAVVSDVFPGFTGPGFIDFVNAAHDYAEFAVDVPAAGTYELLFRYANGSSAARGMELRTNGVVRSGGVHFDPTGSWADWRTARTTVTLAAGTNRVRLSAAGQSGPNLDALTIRPVTQEPPPPPTDGVYQAESAALTGAVVSTVVEGYTGTGFVDYLSAAGDAVEFTVNAAQAGNYTLELRYANGGSTARAMELRVNGAANSGGVSFAPTGGWTAWETVSVPVTLAAGANKVRLAATGQSGPNLDALAVKAAQQPPPPPPAAVTLQAENARRQGAAVANNVAGYTGSGFVDYLFASNEYVEFTVDAARAGRYTLEFRYGNGGAAARALELRVNDAVEDAALAFGPTGAWSAWRAVSVTVDLAAGANRVRLTSVGQSGPNLDALTVRPVA